MLACGDDGPKTTCETKAASAKIAGDAQSVTCALEGEKLSLTTSMSACGGGRDACTLFVNAKTPDITFQISGQVCTTPGEITSSGCGDPGVLTCTGPRPAPGTYDLATQASTARKLEIAADGTCSVK